MMTAGAKTPNDHVIPMCFYDHYNYFTSFTGAFNKVFLQEKHINHTFCTLNLGRITPTKNIKCQVLTYFIFRPGLDWPSGSPGTFPAGRRAFRHNNCVDKFTNVRQMRKCNLTVIL